MLEEMRSELGLRWRVKDGELRLIRAGRASADDLESIVRSMVSYARRLSGQPT